MKYSVITYGCRVNQADSLGLEETLLGRGHRPAASEDADLVVVNTCSVTCSADQGARQTIRRIARLNPDARIVATGCYATRRPDELSQLPNVLHVVPNDHKERLAEVIERGSTTVDRFADGDGACGAAVEPGVAGRTAFTLRVQTGCAEPCSYCIIPATRGAPRSVRLAAILADIARAAAAGFREVALTGVHLGSYGRDLEPPASLSTLLQAIVDHAPPEVRFRISSLEPMDCTPAIVDLVASERCLAPHFHLPLQHASNKVLAGMRRPYTIEEYRRLVDGIRARIPEAAIGTDLIVGFPGERDEDFRALVDYLEASPLTHAHVFPYSDRPGTAAAAMPDRPDGVVVRERARVLREVSAHLAQRFRQSQEGTVHRALTLEDGTLAVTGNYLKVRIPPGHARNTWVRVRIEHSADPMTAEVVSQT